MTMQFFGFRTVTMFMKYITVLVLVCWVLLLLRARHPAQPTSSEIQQQHTAKGEGDDNTSQRGCWFQTNIPMYYINLARTPTRREWMETAFGCSGKLTRIEAVDGRTADMEALIGNGGLKAQNATTLHDYENLIGARITELALTMSHARAIKQAFDDGADVAIFFEDDVSPVLAPYWKVSLDELRVAADTKYPEWELIRLQYTPMQLNHTIRVEKWVRQNPDEVIVKGIVPSYGMVAYMMNKAGMESFLERYMDAEGKFDCTKKRGHMRCLADFVIHDKTVQLQIAPQMFVTRFLEDATGVRGSGPKTVNDHLRTHHNAMARAIQQALQSWEFDLLRKNGSEDLKFPEIPFAGWTLQKFE